MQNSLQYSKEKEEKKRKKTLLAGSPGWKNSTQGSFGVQKLPASQLRIKITRGDSM